MPKVKTEIVPNYTESQEQEMALVYGASNTDAERLESMNEFVSKFGKKLASVRQKLVRMGIYIKPEKTTKTGAKIVRKNELVEQLAKLTESPESDVESMEKATKKALEIVIKTLHVQARTIQDLENELSKVYQDDLENGNTETDAELSGS